MAINIGGGEISGILNWGTGFASASQDRKQVKTSNAIQDSQFQKLLEQSDTAHQREVADLKAAGLNPILSAGGQGSLVGGSASAQQGQRATPISSHLAQSAQMAQTLALADKTRQDARISRADASVAQSLADRANESAFYNAQTARNNAIVSGVDADISNSKVGRFAETTRRLGSALNSVVTPLLSVGRSMSSASAQTSRDDFIRRFSEGQKKSKKVAWEVS